MDTAFFNTLLLTVLLINAPPPKEVRPPTPKDIPRNKDGNALLQERKVLVSNGKVIPFVDPGKQMETAIKNRLKMIIDSKKREGSVGFLVYFTLAFATIPDLWCCLV